MPQQSMEFEECKDFLVIAKKLQSKYPQMFGCDLDKIKCVSITNKTRKDTKKQMWDVLPVVNPIKMDCPFSYYVVIYSSDWVEMAVAQQHLLVASVLLAIPTDDEGKLNKPDLKDYATMVRTFGIDYMDRNDVKDPLAEMINWVVRE